jgi:hypothetical protein
MPDEPTREPQTVAYCPICRTETWHLDGVCEWADGHEQKQARKMVDDDVRLFGSGFLMITRAEDGSRTYKRIPAELVTIREPPATDKPPSCHDLNITTSKISRTSIANLPFRVEVHCTRVGGWQAWAKEQGGLPEELLGGEYDYVAETGKGQWLKLDVAGHVICDSSPKE